MRSGISTACLYPMELENAFSTLISMKFRLFEIFINTFRELRPDYIATLKQMADESGSTVKSIHPFTSGFESFLLFSDYERRFLDGLDFYKQYFHTANLLGATILVLHGQRSSAAKDTDEKSYFEHYARLFALGKTFGVTVAQENVSQFRSEDPLFIAHMRDYLGDGCAFVFDIKQAVRAGQDPYAMCDAMGNRMVHIHLNDNRPGDDCLLPGQGTMDLALLKNKLSGFGYDGDIIIEVYRRSFGGLQELEQAKKVVNAMILQKNA